MDSILTLKDLVDEVVAGRWQGSIATDADQDIALDLALRQALAYCGAVRHQDKVVVLVSNTIETVAALLALWHCGAVVVPVKRDVPQAAVQGIVDDCGAQYLLDPVVPALAPAGGSAPASFRYRSAPRLTGVDLALIIYTSGSTGKPKGIMLTHANVIAALRAILGYLHIGASDTILLISPLSFDYGLYQLLFCLASGCRLVMCRKGTNPISIVNLVEQRAVTVLPLIPALATSLHKYLEKFHKQVHGVRLVTSTGGVFPAHTALALQQLFVGADVVKMYGLTESKRVAYLPAADLARASTSVGIPMPGLDAKVFQEHAQEDGSVVLDELARGEIGQLFVRGSSVFQRYYQPDHGGGARLYPGNYRDDNWLATGDLFLQDQEGFLHFKGRAKDLIKQRGFCLYPRDLEAIVYRHPQVEICAVAAVVDSGGNEIAKLFVTLVERDQTARDAFKAWLAREIDPDYQFGAIAFIDQMPLSANGKVDIACLVRDAMPAAPAAAHTACR